MIVQPAIKPQRTLLVFCGGLLGSALIGWRVAILWSEIEIIWHKSRCPDNSFSYGPLDGLLSTFAIGWVAFFGFILAMLLIISRSDTASVAYATWSPPSRNGYLRTHINILAWLTAIGLTVSTVLCSANFSSTYCMSPKGISIQHPIFGEIRKYRWSEVSKISTICWKGKGGSRVYYMDILLPDKYKLQLPEVRHVLPITEKDIPYFSGIKTALTGATFLFDSSAVEPGCAPLGALVEKP